MLAPQTAYFIRSVGNVNTLRWAVCVSTLLHLTFIVSSPPRFFFSFFLHLCVFLAVSNCHNILLALFLILSSFNSHLHFPVLPTSTILPPYSKIRDCSVSLPSVVDHLFLTAVLLSMCSYLFLSCLSIFAHLPSYNPSASGSVNFYIFFLCILFLSFSISCLPLRQPEYNNVISHSSTSQSPPSSACVFLSDRSVVCWLCCPPCLLASPVLIFSHKLCTHRVGL